MSRSEDEKHSGRYQGKDSDSFNARYATNGNPYQTYESKGSEKDLPRRSPLGRPLTIFLVMWFIAGFIFAVERAYSKNDITYGAVLLFVNTFILIGIILIMVLYIKFNKRVKKFLRNRFN